MLQLTSRIYYKCGDTAVAFCSQNTIQIQHTINTERNVTTMMFVESQVLPAINAECEKK